MTARVVVIIACDRCGLTIQHETWTEPGVEIIPLARASLEARGWRSKTEEGVRDTVVRYTCATCVGEEATRP